MRTVYASLILVILWINSAGFYLYYFVQMRQIRLEMKAKLRSLPPDQLEALVLSLTDFNCARVEEHEIRVDGRMYDIARTIMDGDSVRVFCIHDEKEDNLLALLNDVIGKPMERRSTLPEPVLQFIAMNFVMFSQSFEFVRSAGPSLPVEIYGDLPLSRDGDIPTPPPRVL